MTISTFDGSGANSASEPFAVLRARALADVRRLRELARAARNDGLPKAELRAANARRAAFSVLSHARRISAIACGGTVAVEVGA